MAMTLEEKQLRMRARHRKGRRRQVEIPTKIYLIEHPSGPWYIGLTQNPIEHRWSQHCTTAQRGRGSLLHSTIRTLGAETFEVTELGEYPTRELASEAEKDHIRRMNGTRPGGLNKTKGGAAHKLWAQPKPPWLRRRRFKSVFSRMTIPEIIRYGQAQGW